jgi:hypothetical protein
MYFIYASLVSIDRKGVQKSTPTATVGVPRSRSILTAKTFPLPWPPPRAVHSREEALVSQLWLYYSIDFTKVKPLFLEITHIFSGRERSDPKW